MNTIRTLVPLALLTVAAAARADITSLTDNFDSEPGGQNYDQFANWNVTGGSVDLLDFGLGQGLSVDLDGSSTGPGLLSTKEAFAPGTYNLSFDLAGSQRGDTNDVTVTFGSYSTVLTRDGSDPFSTVSATVTLNSSAMLSFQNGGNDYVGALLDNVKVQAVPEPTSLAALGLGGLAFLRRRNRR